MAGITQVDVRGAGRSYDGRVVVAPRWLLPAGLGLLMLLVGRRTLQEVRRGSARHDDRRR
ncbi:hypothetical protein [Nonomuraea sp. 10N515B]|uniref:hypothetical protein n=1 Tax=Nonomuraea sp. 10N515B TaxID=3457422 RepID=UPI003FCCE600